MSHGHEIDIAKHVRSYIAVLVALLALTVLTVAVYYVHLPPALAIGVGLLIACVKGSLVACIFMHLIDERKVIYLVLIFTVVFFIVLLLLPLAGLTDQVQKVT